MEHALSPAAETLILNAEVGSPDEYSPRPDWPGGSSGVTIGVGYDLGYMGPAAVATDWGPHLPAAAVKRLQQVAGIKGDPARAAADALHDLSVPWDAAKAVFDACDVPRTIAETVSAFPGSGSLPADSFGTLVSLVFNRGALISSTDPAVALRRIEMAQIRDAITQNRAADVPAYLRAMTRLWPPGAGEDGLRARRNAEAQLFAQGIASAGTA